MREQKERTGRINQNFINFMRYGVTPGVGIAFGLNRWVKQLLGWEIQTLKNLGGLL